MGETAQVLIREAKMTDAEAIYEIGKLCFTDAWRKETVIHDMEGKQSQYFVAEKEGQVIGYGCFWFVADEGQLVNIGVRPENRRQHIGEAILSRGLEEAKHCGMKTLFLEVRVSNASAQAMYQKFGFQNLGRRKNVYDLPIEDGYVMEVPLTIGDKTQI